MGFSENNIGLPNKLVSYMLVEKVNNLSMILMLEFNASPQNCRSILVWEYQMLEIYRGVKAVASSTGVDTVCELVFFLSKYQFYLGTSYLDI